MNEYDGKVELTTKEEIKSMKNFLDKLKNESLDYTKINEIIKSKFPGIKCEFYKMGDANIICTDAEYDEAYNEIMFTMILARRHYSRINSNAATYWYTTNRGNKWERTISITIENVTGLYSKTYNCKTALKYYFDGEFASSRDGWNGSGDINKEVEIIAHQNTKPVILHCHKMRNYVSSGQGNNWTSAGYIRRTKYSNSIWFDDLIVYDIWEYGDNSDYLWVTMRSEQLPYSTYKINKEDIVRACKVTKAVKRELDKLNSKLVKDDFIIDLNDSLTNLKGSIDSYVNDKGEIVKEITFYTTGTVANISSGLKFITIKQEDDEDYMYRFNGSIGKESLSYNRPITTDDDIKKSIDLTIDMISHSSVLEVYKSDLLEIKNSL